MNIVPRESLKLIFDKKSEVIFWEENKTKKTYNNVSLFAPPLGLEPRTL